MKWWQSVKTWWNGSGHPETYDVGISVCEAILNDGSDITITRKGRVVDPHYEWYYDSASLISELMEGKWIRADNDVHYNRHYIMSYTVVTKSYVVRKDNTPV